MIQAYHQRKKIIIGINSDIDRKFVLLAGLNVSQLETVGSQKSYRIMLSATLISSNGEETKRTEW